MHPEIVGDGVGFVPVIEAVNDDKAFIAEHPLKIMAKGEAHRIPVLTSHTSGEGIGPALSK